MTDSHYISRLLMAERAEAPPGASTEAGLQRLLGTMASHAAPLPVAVGSLKLGLAAIAKWVGVGFAVGTLGAGVASYASQPANNSSALAPSVAMVPPAPSISVPAVVDAPPVTTASAAADALPNDAKRTGSASAAAAAPSVTSTFDEELRLITAAKHELDAGRGHLARVWLDEHRQRFPRGVFSLEREGLLVLASCSAAPNASLARQFADHHPDSPMLNQLLRRCGAEGARSAPVPASGDFLESDK